LPVGARQLQKIKAPLNNGRQPFDEELMKTAKSAKRKAANHPSPTPALRGGPSTWWMKDMEMLTAVTQCLIEKMREDKSSPMRTAANLLWAQAKAAAERLGFDTIRKDWMKLVGEESNSYPHTQEGIGEEFWQQLPKGDRARIRALELIGYFTDLAKSLEFHILETENWLAELQAALAADPIPMPLPTLISQIDDEEVA
jgi:hypothetical protein